MTAFNDSQNAQQDTMEAREIAALRKTFGPGFRNVFYFTGDSWTSSYKDPERGWYLGTKGTDRRDLAKLVDLVKRVYGAGTLKATKVETGCGPARAFAVVAA